VQQLTETGVGREEQDEVVKWNGADQIQQEPRPYVAASYLVRLQDYLVGEVIGYDTCTNSIATDLFIYLLLCITRSLAVAKRPCDCCVAQFWPNVTGEDDILRTL